MSEVLAMQIESSRKRKKPTPCTGSKKSRKIVPKLNDVNLIETLNSLMMKCDSEKTPKIAKPTSTQIPQLSEGTANLLKSLQITSHKPENRPTEEILNSKPMKEIYGHLLEPQMPLHYKKVLTMFERTDNTMNYAKHRKAVTSFENIKKGIEEVYRANYDIEMLQKILFIDSTLYKTFWAKDNAKEYKLFLEFPAELEKEQGQISNEKVEERKKNLRKKLLDLVKTHHLEFLQSTNEVWESESSWHPNFDISKVPDVPVYKIPEKPVENSETSISDFLKKQFEINEKNRKIDITPEIIDANDVIPGLNPELTAKIRMKDRLSKERLKNLQPTQNISIHAKVERMTTLCEMLKSIFLSQKTPSIFYGCLVKKIKGTGKISTDSMIVEKDLNDAIELFPSWLKLIETSAGKVVRMNRQLEMPLTTIQKEVNAKFN